MDSTNTLFEDDGVVVRADGQTLLAKLCFDSRARLGELADCSVESLRSKFDEFYGPEAAAGELSYTLGNGDDDELQLVTDADVRLAKKHGAEPIKVTSTPRPFDDRAAPPQQSPFVATLNGAPMATVFDHANAQLAKFGLEAPASELKKLLDVLEFKPRRLVKCGLAPASALKNDDASPQQAEPVEDDDDDDEPLDGVELVEALTLDDPDEEKAEKAEPVAGEAAAAAAAAAMEDVEAPAADVDVVATAIAAKGVALAPNVLHAVLRVLHVRPRRVVKVGLVDDIKAARAAYKAGGKSAAAAMFRGEKGVRGKGCGKGGWGRGLHGRGGAGGRGRGAGWAHAVEPPKKRSCGGGGRGGGSYAWAWSSGPSGGQHWGSPPSHHGRGHHGRHGGPPPNFWAPPHHGNGGPHRWGGPPPDWRRSGGW